MRNLNAFGVVGATSERVEDQFKLPCVMEPPCQPREPVHRRGKAVFLLHQGAKAFAGQRTHEEMAGQDALHIDARVLDAGYEVVPQHRGVVLHP